MMVCHMKKWFLGILFALGPVSVSAFCGLDPALAQNPFSLVLPWDDASPGVTNFQALNHIPAGKYGPVTPGPDGHYYVGSQRIRFIGVNLTGEWCMPSKEDAPAAAARMAKFGINLVRCHLFDTSYYPYGIFDRSRINTRALDPEMVDRMDYFISALKQNGIYVNLNLLAGRKFVSADGLPSEIDTVDWGYQHFIAIFNQPLIDLQKEFAQQLLSHVNPYTGVSYTQEPAIAFLELNNEQGLDNQWRRGNFLKVPAVFLGDLAGQWNAWLAARYGNTDALQAAWGAGVILGPEMLANGDFSSGTSNWSIQISAPAVANKTLTSDVPPGVTGQSLRLDVMQAGTAGWHVQLLQEALAVQADQPYTVTFWAKADQTRTIDIAIRQALSPWAELDLAKPIALSSSWQQFQFTFWVSRTESNARLEFANMGLQAGGSFSFAGISLRSGGAVGVQTGERIESANVPLFTTKADYLLRTVPAQRDWIRFLHDTEDSYYQTLRTNLKTTLGSQAVVLGTQVNYSTVNTMSKLDGIDIHAYWQHPVYNGSNWSMKNISMVNNVKDHTTVGGTIADIADYRVLNRPMSISEYNHVGPNTYASEAFLMLAAYAALQDWDAIYAYSYWGPHGYSWSNGIPSWTDVDLSYDTWHGFTINNQPAKMATLPVAAAMFRRGDLSPAHQQVVVPISSDQEIDLKRSVYARNASASRLGVPRGASLTHRLAIATEGQSVPNGALGAADVAALANLTTFVSDNGELVWDMSQANRGVLQINTPRSKGIIGYGGGKRFDLGGVVIEPGASLQNGWSTINVTVVEGDLSSRNRLLITTTGRTEHFCMAWNPGEGDTITRDANTVPTQWGKAPSLVEGVPAVITFPMLAAGVHAWALDERGQRKLALPVNADANGNAVISLGPESKTLWYEVTYEPADLSIAMTASVLTPLSINDSLTYTLTVTNTGPSTASAVTLTDTLPSGVSLVSVSTGQGNCTGATTISCNLGGMVNGASATVTIMAKATTPGTQTNTATVSNTGTDPNTANNSASVSVTVLPSCSTVGYKISGQARKNSSSGPELAGVTMRLAGPGCGDVTITNAAKRNYQFIDLNNGNYDVTPSKAGCIFTPTSRSITLYDSDVFSWRKTGFVGTGESCN